jgi:hypothetical protein
VAASTKPALTGTVTINKNNPVLNDFLSASFTGNGTGAAYWQWLADGKAIQGANDSFYQVVTDDVGKTLIVRVSYADQSGSVTSSPTAKVTGIAVDNTFNSIAGFASWLSSQPENSTNTAYRVALNVNNLGGNASVSGSLGAVLIANTNRYVYLDLSGSSITTIPDGAFGIYSTGTGCTTLAGITIPNGVTTIGKQAFYRCKNLTSVTIPNSVQIIDSGAFQSSGLTSVTIPSGVINIGNFAFNTSSLASIIVDSGNREYSSDGGVLYDKNKTVLRQYPAGKIGAFTIPNSVTIIGSCAFIGSRLTSVTLPDSVVSILDNAFSGASLTGITIPSRVASIGESAFASCYNLTAITVDAGNSAYISENGVLYDKNKTVLIQYPAGKTGAFTIPGSVTTIGIEAFTGSGFTSITIPSNVTSIGEWAFEFTNLTSVTFAAGSNIANFGDDAFPEGSDGYGGNTLKTAYSSGGAGTYTRAVNGSTWSKQ